MTNKEMNIYEVLTSIQNELKAPKSKTNKFGRYNYRSAEDILESVKPILKKHNCTITISDEIVCLGDNHPVVVAEIEKRDEEKNVLKSAIIGGGARFYVKATVTLYFKDKQISTTALAREAKAKKGMGDAQITGSASSYARKYALGGIFALDDTKDDDDFNNNKGK
jgi:hypothetical protein